MIKKSPQQIIIQRIIITSSLIYIFLIGKTIPLPCVDHKAIENLVLNNTNYNNLNYISGNSLALLGLFTLNIFPLLNASIILQFLIPIVPYLNNLQKEEGELGQREINKVKKILTLIISVIQSINLVTSFNFFISNKLIVILFLVTGAMIVTWISDLLTDKGIATGPSLLLFVNILTNPKIFLDIKNKFLGIPSLEQAYNLVILLFISSLVVVLLGAKTQIPILTIKQLQSRDNLRSTKKNATIPLKLNQGGILPVALATAASLLPQSIFGQVPYIKTLTLLFTIFLIIILNYFYTIFLWNPKKISDDLKKVSSTIPGIRPGIATENYLNQIVTRYSVLGGILLAFITLLPSIIKSSGKITYFIFDSINITSLIILLGVVVEILKNLRSLLTSTSYLQ